MSEARLILYPTAVQLRTLAHPLRARLLGTLRRSGPATATQLAERLGTNSGATSYHLRQLADAGLVEDDAARSTRRDRVWRSVHHSTAWRSTDFDDDPDGRAADDWIARNQVRTTSRWLDAWLDQRDEWPTEWRAVADLSDYQLALTADQLGALMTELHAVLARYQALEDRSQPEAHDVTVLLQGFPSTSRW